jgi:hypothetical protein
MNRNDYDSFTELFLDAEDLPSQMLLYGDRRIGFSEPADQAYHSYGGLKAGMTQWEGPRENTLRLLVDIRWLFSDARFATAYHLATLQAKSEGKRENQTAHKIGDDCHVYSFPSGQELAVAQGVFAGALGDDSQMARGIGRAIAEMPDDAFIYLFTRGPVAVKCFAVLGTLPMAIETRKSAVHAVAKRIVSRIDRAAFPNFAGKKPAVWWRRIFSN